MWQMVGSDTYCRNLQISLYNKADNTSLPWDLSYQLHQIWISACGIPRTIELFAKLMAHHLPMLSAIPRDSTEVLTNEQEATFNEKMLQKRYIMEFQEILGLNNKEFNEFLLMHCFTLSRSQLKPLDPKPMSTLKQLAT
jgi:hypothetical protein